MESPSAFVVRGFNTTQISLSLAPEDFSVSNFQYATDVRHGLSLNMKHVDAIRHQTPHDSKSRKG